ncbi:MAG: alpha-2-macroglobulin [Lentisphaerae bacterium]|nr:alpha-2-macroglobulin [Lentisphaerota bacterium]
MDCLGRLHRLEETDALIEDAVAAHASDWRLLRAAAREVFNLPHYGTLIAGAFRRGPHRGGGVYVNSFERDRVRALQLMERARTLCDAPPREQAAFLLDYASFLLGYRGTDEAWRLQILADLSTLPDYEEGHRYERDGGAAGAPVDADGNPVFHAVPAGYADAATDGERWRWMLHRAAQLDPAREPEILKDFADFLHQQFGVQTMAYHGRPHPAPLGTEDADDTSGPYAVHTLGRGETIARLATGIRRFALPDGFNFIALYERVAAAGSDPYAEQALNRLAEIFENRRQYDAAAAFWRRSIDAHGPGNRNWKALRLAQIVDPWGSFEPVLTRPAGQPAAVAYRFRNGRRVRFEAHRLDVDRLLADVKAYLNSNPRRLDGSRLQVGNIGYRIVRENETQYRGEQVAGWDLALDPDPRRFDRRITVETPLTEPGAYLLRAALDGGNTVTIVVWLNDTVIARKPLDRQTWFFVADAVTGEPLDGVNVACFGFRQIPTDWNRAVGRRYNIATSHFAATTGADGQVRVDADALDDDYRWLIVARRGPRLAYLGFSGVWYGRQREREYEAARAFTITDRPVYRPNQPVHFKAWVRHARYDQDATSDFAGQTFTLRIDDPQGTKVHEAAYTADAYGGVAGNYLLPDDAPLGVYRITIPNRGSGTFRVEEYKKPEFEVAVDAPAHPVMLGETVTATVRARYYFGEPVVDARVRVTVLRSAYDAAWYPPAPWDWLYGPGYWWFGYDYAWYPGWDAWGCERPRPWWLPPRRTPPEVVAEIDVPIGPDGAVAVPIDTAVARAFHGDTDHRYTITAEVTDRSRRTVVGRGDVLVARRPFKVHVWVDRGYYHAGDTIRADVAARTLDGRPVRGRGELTLYRVRYPEAQPVETAVESWRLDPDAQGRAGLALTAARPGQYRLAYSLTDTNAHTIEGAYVFCVAGRTPDPGASFRFNDLEIVPDRKAYAPGETARLMVRTARPGATVVLFVRPADGVYLEPALLRLDGRSAVHTLEIDRRDMPNIFVEALTVADGRLHAEARELVVPPEKRVLNVAVEPTAETCKPGESTSVRLRLTDFSGNPVVGSVVLSVYDKAVDYIAGGANVPDIRQFFWSWRRRHHPRTEHNLDRRFHNLDLPDAAAMQAVGVFGRLILDEGADPDSRESNGAVRRFATDAVKSAAPMLEAAEQEGGLVLGAAVPAAEAPAAAEPVVRKAFADTAFWAAALQTDADGTVAADFDMPENLTTWKVRAWAMGHGTACGEGTAEVITRKNLILRLQAPRFCVEKDEVVLSANIHNYLATAATVTPVLELDGGCLERMPSAGPAAPVVVPPGGEHRADWRVRAVREGEAVVRMKALAGDASDAMEMRFPVHVHGMPKTVSFCGSIAPDAASAAFSISVPAARRVDRTRFELRWSPTLAGALVDALPYLASYPHGCTEQTLNRFLPAVIARQVLAGMGLDLAAVRDKRTNLNPQEIGDDRERAAQWQRHAANPVFDEAALDAMIRRGVNRLLSMQLADGGWGWFSGWGEHATPHMTATVVHGLQAAEAHGAALVPGMLERGVQWLEAYQADQVRRLNNAESKTDPWKTHADNLDALVFRALADAGREDTAMRAFLYRDRNTLAVYGKALFGLALHRLGHGGQRDMLIRNIGQYLVEDDENETAWLNLGNEGTWWTWYGSEYEAQAAYLKLLAATDPRGDTAARLVKYLLNNRKHATYWNSTRDTALCIEAMADTLRAGGEARPDMTLDIAMDGRTLKTVRIAPSDLFAFDNRLVLEGDAVPSGEHEITVARRGAGRLYFNAYLDVFTLEDFMTRAGLEIKIGRAVYRLTRAEAAVPARGARGQALRQRVETYTRERLDNGAQLESGDLVEVELTVESKNDYEYIILEDYKAAGFEPVDVRSGYRRRGLPAYVELRDETVCFFVRRLARGTHSLAYRLRAEIPGRFSALPARARAMYAPELKANADEIRLRIADPGHAAEPQ